jgi:hypothetical protein
MIDISGFETFCTITSLDLFLVMETFQVDKNQVLILTSMASGLILESDTINNIALNVKGYFL